MGCEKNKGVCAVLVFVTISTLGWTEVGTKAPSLTEFYLSPPEWNTGGIGEKAVYSLLHYIPGTVDDVFTAVSILPAFQPTGEVWTRPRLLGIPTSIVRVNYNGFPLFHSLMPGRFPFLGFSENFSASVDVLEPSGTFGPGGSLNINTSFRRGSFLDLNPYRISGYTGIRGSHWKFYGGIFATHGALYSEEILNTSIPYVFQVRSGFFASSDRMDVRVIGLAGSNYYSGIIPRVSSLPVGGGKINWNSGYGIIGTSISHKTGKRGELKFAFSMNSYNLKSRGKLDADVRAGVMWTSFSYTYRLSKVSIETGFETIYLDHLRGYADLPLNVYTSSQEEVPHPRVSFSRRAMYYSFYAKAKVTNFQRTTLEGGVNALSTLPYTAFRFSPSVLFRWSPLNWLTFRTGGKITREAELDLYSTAISPKPQIVKGETLIAEGMANAGFLTLSVTGFFRNFSNFTTFAGDVSLQDPCSPVVTIHTGDSESIRANGIICTLSTNFEKYRFIASYYYGKTYTLKGREGYPEGYNHSLRLLFIYLGKKWRFSGLFTLTSSKPYTPLETVGAVPDPCSGTIIYYPVWGEKNSAFTPWYYRADAMVERVFQLRNVLLVAYLDVFNLLYLKNILGYTYSKDFSRKESVHSLPPIPLIGVRAVF